MILLDTNLLGRLTDSADPLCIVARRAVHTLLAKRERLIVVPRNLYEFWAVATPSFAFFCFFRLMEFLVAAEGYAGLKSSSRFSVVSSQFPFGSSTALGASPGGWW